MWPLNGLVGSIGASESRTVAVLPKKLATAGQGNEFEKLRVVFTSRQDKTAPSKKAGNKDSSAAANEGNGGTNASKHD